MLLILVSVKMVSISSVGFSHLDAEALHMMLVVLTRRILYVKYYLDTFDCEFTSENIL
jgi:hypothetical protein